jgi:hypothetical protein
VLVFTLQYCTPQSSGALVGTNHSHPHPVISTSTTNDEAPRATAPPSDGDPERELAAAAVRRSRSPLLSSLSSRSPSLDRRRCWQLAARQPSDQQRLHRAAARLPRARFALGSSATHDLGCRPRRRRRRRGRSGALILLLRRSSLPRGTLGEPFNTVRSGSWFCCFGGAEECERDGVDKAALATEARDEGP